MNQPDWNFFNQKLVESIDYYDSISSCHHLQWDGKNPGWPDSRLMKLCDFARTFLNKNDERIIDFIHAFTGQNFFTYGRQNSDLHFHETLQNFLTYIFKECKKSPWENIFLQESEIVAKEMTTMVNGKLVSHMFLWHFCIYEKIVRTINQELDNILEIGGGYGGLGRVFKLGIPNATYWILDLPESLLYSSFYLKINFPNAKFCFINDESQFSKINFNDEKFDFVFIPPNLMNLLDKTSIGCQIDLIINTASLGEMDQTTVDSYFNLINNQIKPSYIYSVNLFGSPNNACDYATPIGPNWRIKEWNVSKKKTFTHADPRYPSFLEFLAKRVPAKILSESYLSEISNQLMNNELSIMGRNNKNSEDWTFAMWESVRLNEGSHNLPIWLQFLSTQGFFHEYKYYLGRYANYIFDKNKFSRPLYVWPANRSIEKIISFFIEQNIDVSGILYDHNSKTEEISGLKVFTPTNFKQTILEGNERPFVVIAHTEFQKDIATTLENIGYRQYFDFLFVGKNLFAS